LLIGIVRDAHGGKASGTFSQDLPLMMEQATKDAQIAAPGEPKTQAQRVRLLVSALQRVLNGHTFTVDTEDGYIGAIIELANESMTRRPFGADSDEILFVRHYEKARLLARFRLLLISGDLAQASDVAISATEKFPDYGPAWTSLGVAKMASAKYEAAEASFANAKKFALDPQAYHASALLYIAQGRSAKAQREAESAAAIDPQLQELSSEPLQYLRASQPTVWGTYRSQLGERLPGTVIKRAFDAPTEQPKSKDTPSGPEDRPSMRHSPGQYPDPGQIQRPTGSPALEIRPSR
jgi:tetratricopeptide (TPR) repeat protein